jgi:hypothetical protein
VDRSRVSPQPLPLSAHTTDGCWLWLARGLLCVSSPTPHPRPSLDLVEANSCVNGLTCCPRPDQTGTNWLFPLGWGLELRLPRPACSWPSGGPQVAPSTGWSPQDMEARIGKLEVRRGAPLTEAHPQVGSELWVPRGHKLPWILWG